MTENRLHLWTGIGVLAMATSVFLGSYSLIPATLSSAVVSGIGFVVAWIHFRADVGVTQSLGFVSVGFLFATETLIQAGLESITPVKTLFMITTLGLGAYLIFQVWSGRATDEN